MRPLRLTMTAFGPYAGTEVVDFEALSGVGLFVVAGNNGAGKTTIFDALHYSLYGMLPGRRAAYARLKSDHADAKTECKVALEFAAHGKHWRVERTPAQTRAKRRGSGTTEAGATATLFRFEQGEPVAVTNRLEEVRAKCAELVGLSGRQFERVALLPQGEFSRVLREKSTERRALLRTLFSSEIFDDATALIADKASAATASDVSQREQLAERQRALSADLAALTGRTVDSPTDDLAGLVADFRRVELVRGHVRVNDLEQDHAAAARDLDGAKAIALRIERRQQVREEQRVHEQNRSNHDRDIERLAAARTAVPVVSNARTVGQHEQRLRAARTSTEQLHHALSQELTAAGLNPPSTLDERTIGETATRAADLADRLKARNDTLLHANDLAAVTTRLQGDLRRKANEIQTRRDQKDVAQSQLRQTTAELNRLAAAAADQPDESRLRELQAQLAQRNELATLEAEHQRLVAQATTADAELDELATALHDAQQDAGAAGDLEHRAKTAFDALAECERRAKASQEFRLTTTKLANARGELQTASANHDRLWDGFIGGTAARVAEHLVDDEPCPVCGSCEHPAPATPSTETSVTEQVVRDARTHVDTLRDNVRSLETQVEHLLGDHPDLATTSLAEIAAEISTAKAMALGARAVADDAHRAGMQAATLSDKHKIATAARGELEQHLQLTDKRQLLLRGALGTVANQTPHTLQQHVDSALQAQVAAAQLAEQHSDLSATIADLVQNIETIGLGEIAAKSRHDLLLGQLAERQVEQDRLATELAAHDAKLAPVDTQQARRAPEQRAQAVRKAQELLTQVQTTAARHDEAADGLRRAQSILADRLAASSFTSVDQAMAAFIEPHVLEQIEAHTTAYTATDERLRGQLSELAELPDESPDVAALATTAELAADAFAAANRELIAQTTRLDRIGEQLAALTADRERFATADPATRRLERVAALVKGDNDRNMSLENWVLAAHLRDVVDLANVRLARSTHQRFQLCVLDDGENRRGKWGLDLGVEDTVTGTQRPAAGLSGGELFQASLALALGLADAVMNQSSGVHIDALFIDEGFGSLDEQSVERAIDLLDELRDRGAMVGVITHVPALLDALPLGISVVDAPGGNGSTIRQERLAA